MKRLLVFSAGMVAATTLFLGCSDSSIITREYTKVESELFTAASYNKITHKLELSFTDGKVHTYDTVPFELATSMIEAPSPDKAYTQKIKGKYTFSEPSPSAP